MMQAGGKVVNTMVWFITIVVAALALIARIGARNRVAEVSLLVTLLVLSLFVSGFGVLLGVLGPRLLVSAAELSISTLRMMSLLAVAAGLVGISICVAPLRRMGGRRAGNQKWTEPPVVLALWLFVMVLASNVMDLASFTETEATFTQGLHRLSLSDMLTSELPLLVVAVVGVGVGIRRNPRQTLARLGYGYITVPQLGVVALFVVVWIVLGFVSDELFQYLQPDLYDQVGSNTEKLFVPQDLNPLAAVLFALLLALSAGLGEETLFRGALQPVFGIALTSILFASMHKQYGPSVALAYVFLLSVALGVLRRRLNTTASFLAHASYDFLLTILAYLGAG
ncbi:MAG: CPBP family intramembrane metalloprotease [Rubrobacter sp.]|nr:CPBP family intramembrane metalloprotease [Rubrobacter sp.]